MALQWRVVGGADKGGIVVRAGKELKSAEAKSRLATDAVVEMIAMQGDRLQYKLVSGQGPDEGWVSVKLKDKVLVEPLGDTEGTADGATAAQSENSLKKSWGFAVKFKGCGAKVKGLKGGSAGASRDAVFDHLLQQHLLVDLRNEFRSQIPSQMYDTGQANEHDCIVYFTTAGEIEPDFEGSRFIASPDGVRQHVAELGGLRCIILEREVKPETQAAPTSAVMVLAHGFSVLGDDLYGLSHLLMRPKLRIVLPAAPHELAEQPKYPEDQEEDPGEVYSWRRPVLTWWPIETGDVNAAVQRAGAALAGCASAALESAPGAQLLLGGFSQGSAVALSAASVITPTGLVLLSPPALAPDILPAGALSDVHVFATVGIADQVNPVAAAEETLSACSAAGARCDPLLKHAGEHEVNVTVANGVNSYLNSIVGR